MCLTPWLRWTRALFAILRCYSPQRRGYLGLKRRFHYKGILRRRCLPLLRIEVVPLHRNFAPYKFSTCTVRISTTMNCRETKLNFLATKVQSTLRNPSGVRKASNKESSEVIKIFLLRNRTPKPV
jgi:hypothetical protein